MSTNSTRDRDHPHHTSGLQAYRDLEEAKAARQWREELGSWLTHFEWQLYATPTFRFPVTHSMAKAVVDRWIGGFGPQAYAYVGYEQGLAGGRTHCHVLLGGLANEIAKSRAGRLWRHGNIQIERYDPNRGAAWYVAKVPEAGEIVGKLIRRTRRARGR